MFSYFIFCGIVFYGGFIFIKGKNGYDFINKSLPIFVISFLFFLLHLICLNNNRILNSDWAGLFPKMIHILLLNSVNEIDLDKGVIVWKVVGLEVGFAFSIIFIFYRQAIFNHLMVLKRVKELDVKTKIMRFKSWLGKAVYAVGTTGAKIGKTTKKVWEQEKKVGVLFRKVDLTKEANKYTFAVNHLKSLATPVREDEEGVWRLKEKKAASQVAQAAPANKKAGEHGEDSGGLESREAQDNKANGFLKDGFENDVAENDLKSGNPMQNDVAGQAMSSDRLRSQIEDRIDIIIRSEAPRSEVRQEVKDQSLPSQSLPKGASGVSLDGQFVEVDTDEIDFDFSSLGMGSVLKSKRSHDIDENNESNEGMDVIVIDPEKKPSVLNSKNKEYFKHNEINLKADGNLLKYSEYMVRDSNFEDSIRRTAKKLESTIREFGIEAKVVQVSSGPVITQYEITIEAGVKISKIVNLTDNIALSLAAPSVRIVAPIPGKGVIGIEIPNHNRQMVRLRDVIESDFFESSNNALPIALGKSILGQPVVKNIATTPHLLVAGATGSGKSVCVNSIITSLLISRSPDEVRFIMIDPKMVELNVYNGIPHLLAPVITDPKKASLALRWVIAEMESRYYLLEKYGSRSITSYNDIIKAKVNKNEFIEDNLGTLPYIVVIIDEFADLMMIAKKEVEDSVSRLAAMSRAVGIHLILATQRPSVDVITGVIKANFPSRIAFQVSSKIDSRTIMDTNGADQLLGKGDMLFSDSGSPIPERIQGAFLSDDEVGNIVKDLKVRGGENYLEDIFAIGENTDKNALNEIQDDLFDEAVWVVINDKKASASYLQRKLKIGYNRAARIVEKMEEIGVVGPADGSRPREVLVSNWKGISTFSPS